MSFSCFWSFLLHLSIGTSPLFAVCLRIGHGTRVPKMIPSWFDAWYCRQHGAFWASVTGPWPGEMLVLFPKFSFKKHSPSMLFFWIILWPRISYCSDLLNKVILWDSQPSAGFQHSLLMVFFRDSPMRGGDFHSNVYSPEMWSDHGRVGIEMLEVPTEKWITWILLSPTANWRGHFFAGATEMVVVDSWLPGENQPINKKRCKNSWLSGFLGVPNFEDFLDEYQ